MAGGRSPRTPGARPGPLSANRASFLLALLVLALLPLRADPAGFAALPGPAAPYAEMAIQAAADSNWLLVRELAAAGLELEGSSSDLRYLGARALLSLGEGGGAALPELEAALAPGRFALVSETDAILLRAELLVELRRYTEALGALGPASGPVSEPPSPELLLRPEYRLLRARAFYGLGRGGEARGELAEALRRFPDDTRFPRLFFEREAAPPGAEARRLGEAILRRIAQLSELDPELSILALPFIPDAARRRDSLLAYRAAGKASPGAILAALRDGLIGPEAAVAEFFGLGSRLRLAALEALAEELGGKEEGRVGLAALSRTLASFTGSLEADRDGDGFAEEVAGYEGGSLASWSFDADHDGQPELRASFIEGIPSEGSFALGGLELEASFSTYPHLASLRFASLPQRPLLGASAQAESELEPARLYRFGTESPICRPLELRSFPTPEASFYLPRPTGEALPTERAASALALELRRNLPEAVELVSLDRGIPLRREEYQEGSLRLRLDYEAGLPSREILDLDGDGRFETERLYKALEGGASLATIRIDLDGDGAFDYREELTAPFRKEWDYNGDGLADAAESLGPDGWRLREFSTRLDGGFDERLLFDAQGLLISAEREGAALPLLPDSNPLLQWLRQKPFDLGSNLPAEEGVYRHMGLRYRLIYAGKAAFAELIP